MCCTLALGRVELRRQNRGGAELQPEIAGGPDIRPAEREDQIDFGAPPPDALEANEGGKRCRIIGTSEPDEIKFAARHRRSQPAGVIHLLPAEAAAAQRGVVEGEKRRGRKRLAQPGEPAVSRMGRNTCSAPSAAIPSSSPAGA